MIEGYTEFYEMYAKYLKTVEETYALWEKAASLTCLTSITELNAYVNTVNEMKAAIMRAQEQLMSCFWILLQKNDISLGGKVIYTEKKRDTQLVETLELTGTLNLGEVPSVFRGDLCPPALAVDGIGILFIPEERGVLPNGLTAKPLARLFDDNEKAYLNPDLIIKDVEWMKNNLKFIE